MNKQLTIVLVAAFLVINIVISPQSGIITLNPKAIAQNETRSFLTPFILPHTKMMDQNQTQNQNLSTNSNYFSYSLFANNNKINFPSDRPNQSSIDFSIFTSMPSYLASKNAINSSIVIGNNTLENQTKSAINSSKPIVFVPKISPPSNTNDNSNNNKQAISNDSNNSNSNYNNKDNNNYEQRGKYLTDDNGNHYYDVKNCSNIIGSSGIGNMSECEDAEKEIRED